MTNPITFFNNYWQNDTGIGGIFTTFIKARLVCSIPGSPSFYYNDIRKSSCLYVDTFMRTQYAFGETDSANVHNFGGYLYT